MCLWFSIPKLTTTRHYFCSRILCLLQCLWIISLCLRCAIAWPLPVRAAIFSVIVLLQLQRCATPSPHSCTNFFNTAPSLGYSDRTWPLALGLLLQPMRPFSLQVTFCERTTHSSIPVVLPKVANFTMVGRPEGIICSRLIPPQSCFAAPLQLWEWMFALPTFRATIAKRHPCSAYWQTKPPVQTLVGWSCSRQPKQMETAAICSIASLRAQ